MKSHLKSNRNWLVARMQESSLSTQEDYSQAKQLRTNNNGSFKTEAKQESKERECCIQCTAHDTSKMQEWGKNIIVTHKMPSF